MDVIFEPHSFKDEIIWTMRGIGRRRRIGKFPVDTQTLWFYTKASPYTFNEQTWEDTIAKPYKSGAFVLPTGYSRDDHGRVFWTSPRGDYTEESIERLEKLGRIYRTSKGTVRIKYFARETSTHVIVERPVTNSWADIPDTLRTGGERLGYPTQKPEALLERIIKASSNEGDIILDPFCGCGTTINVAERLHRRWIGIDITHLAITLMKHRLADTFHAELSPYEVIGDPKDLASAEALAQQDRYQFEWWALGLVDARPAQDKKKGADTGIDGYIYFFDDETGKAKKIVVQVKSGHVTANQIRDLKGVMQRDQAEIGTFITLQEPTSPMLKEAATAGFYEPQHFANHKYPRLQILTIKDLLAGKQLEYPRVALSPTFKKAERKEKEEQTKQGKLLLPDDLQDFVWFGYYTGWRHGQIANLQWWEVAQDVIRLGPEKVKNKSGLVLPLVGELADIIARRQAICRGDAPWVFYRIRNGNIQPVGRFDKAWRTACEKAGLPVERATKKHFHDLRRTTARNLNRAGVPDRIAMSLMGHKTRSMYDRYNIVDEDDMRDASAQMQSWIQSRHNSGTKEKIGYG